MLYGDILLYYTTRKKTSSLYRTDYHTRRIVRRVLTEVQTTSLEHKGGEA